MIQGLIFTLIGVRCLTLLRLSPVVAGLDVLSGGGVDLAPLMHLMELRNSANDSLARSHPIVWPILTKY